MKLVRHINFSVLFAAILGIVLARVVSISIYAYGMLAAALPDLDCPNSPQGRLFPQLSRYIERHSGGHRSFTHSLGALACFAVLSSPLLLMSGLVYGVGVVGYLSHLFADMMTKTGCPLFWPSNQHAVFPRAAKNRVAVGSRAEKVLGLVMLILALMAVYTNSIGLWSLMHRVFKDIKSGVQEYQEHENQTRSFARIEGVFAYSQEPVSETFEIIGLLDPNTLMVLDSQRDAVWAVGNSRDHASIFPDSISVFPGESIEVRTEHLGVSNQLLGGILPQIPTGALVSGVLISPDELEWRSPPTGFQTLRKQGERLELRFARLEDLHREEVVNLFVAAGELSIRSVRSRGTEANLLPKQARKPELSPWAPTELFITQLAGPEDVLIEEGMLIQQGELLAKRSQVEKELRIEEARLQQQLVRLQRQEVDASTLMVLEAQVMLAKKQSEAIERELESLERLLKAGVIAEARLHQKQNQLTQENLHLQQAQERYARAQTKLKEQSLVRDAELHRLQYQLQKLQQQQADIFVHSPIHARVLNVRPSTLYDSGFAVRIRLLALADTSTQPAQTGSSVSVVSYIAEEKNTKQKRRQ